VPMRLIGLAVIVLGAMIAVATSAPVATRRAGGPPSTRAGWSTRPRVRLAPDGSGRRGARSRVRRARCSRP